jgi:hypothetical protein
MHPAAQQQCWTTLTNVMLCLNLHSYSLSGLQSMF